MRDHRPELHSVLIHSVNENVRNKANFLVKINQEIHKILPHTKNICRIANYRDGILVLECASSAWMMRLNYERQLLISSLRKTELPSLMTIEVNINPDLAKAEIDRFRKHLPPKAPISVQSANHLNILAECFPSKLAEKLKKIAALSNQSSD